MPELVAADTRSLPKLRGKMLVRDVCEERCLFRDCVSRDCVWCVGYRLAGEEQECCVVSRASLLWLGESGSNGY